MRRTFVLGIIVLGVITTSLLAAQGGAPAGQGREGRAGGGGGGGGRGPGFPPVQAIEKVKDNLYLIQGQGGNTAVYVAQTGVVVVDTKLANNGQAILDQIKTVTDKPITHIINTLTHGDHTGDLPSVFVNNDSTVSMRFDIDRIAIADLVNRVVILHAKPDNFGNVPVGTADDQYTPGKDALAKTQATGNASDRIACGVIRVGK